MKQPASASPTAVDELRRLADEHWDYTMTEFPMFATYLGDPRGADRLDVNDGPTRERRDGVWASLRKRLAAVPAPAAGTEADITRRTLDLTLRNLAEDHRHRDWEWGVDQIFGPQVALATLMTVQPVGSAKSLDDVTSRLAQVPRYLDDHVADLREGKAKKRVPPRLAVRRVIAQLESLTASPADRTPFVAVPLSRLAASTKPAERDAWTRRLAAAVDEHVLPAYRRYLAFLRDELVAVSRDDVGIWSIPGGDASYDHRVRQMTTTDLTPEEIHRIGLEELERNQAEMLEIARAEGHKGDLRSFLAATRSDPRFRLSTREQILERYRAICARMDAALPRVFGRLPKRGYEVRQIEEYREKDSPAAFYQHPAEDGSRLGIFWANTHDPSSWPTYDFENLCFHEAVPGHHLQIAIAQELSDLPAFRRHDGFTAYIEGWAHYTERLADEMGMYSTPYDRVGMLSAQAWRAARLVVDTGMHRLRWTREKAIELLESIRAGSSSDVENEVDRYIIWPGQALAYKVGSRTITDLREKAKRRLGSRFDLRGFHDEVLRHGAVPLSILAETIDRWAGAKSSGS